MNKKNISIFRNCYGCGVCAISCPQKIISIKINKEGFYEPYIEDEHSCINCGLCLDVCAFNHKTLFCDNIDLKSWAAWSNNINIRERCSSGGISFEIGKYLLENNFKVVGCKYNINKQIAEHYISTKVEELFETIGSKYIQSYTMDAFKQIDKKQKYLIIGTPCQIDSFRRYIKRFHCEQNFILMDFFCHCVPSIYAWRSYVKMVEKNTGNIKNVSWRNKITGWHDSWVMKIMGERNNYVSWMSKGDLFYKLFLGDMCLGQQCQKHCKYKWDKSSADIRIGDMWGETFCNDEKGVNAVVAFTKVGVDLIKNIKNITIKEYPFEIVAEGQMKNNAKRKEMSKIVMLLLRNNISLTNPLFKVVFFIQRCITKIKTLLI